MALRNFKSLIADDGRIEASTWAFLPQLRTHYARQALSHLHERGLFRQKHSSFASTESGIEQNFLRLTASIDDQRQLNAFDYFVTMHSENPSRYESTIASLGLRRLSQKFLASLQSDASLKYLQEVVERNVLSQIIGSETHAKDPASNQRSLARTLNVNPYQLQAMLANPSENGSHLNPSNYNYVSNYQVRALELEKSSRC